jgi:hypothetical protein
MLPVLPCRPGRRHLAGTPLRRSEGPTSRRSSLPGHNGKNQKGEEKLRRLRRKSASATETGIQSGMVQDEAAPPTSILFINASPVYAALVLVRQLPPRKHMHQHRRQPPLNRCQVPGGRPRPAPRIPPRRHGLCSNKRPWDTKGTREESPLVPCRAPPDRNPSRPAAAARPCFSPTALPLLPPPRSPCRDSPPPCSITGPYLTARQSAMRRRGVHHAASGFHRQSSHSSCLYRSSPSPPYDAGIELTAGIRLPHPLMYLVLSTPSSAFGFLGTQLEQRC